jgi:16S rRNA (uracil1498-N3)-methyltransferase
VEIFPLPRTGGEGRVRGLRADRRAKMNRTGPLTPTLSPALTHGGEGERGRGKTLRAAALLWFKVGVTERPRTRLFVQAELAAGASVGLAAPQAHLLKSVLRLERGAAVALFNGRDGEWRGRIDGFGKGWCSIAVEGQTREQAPEPDLWLAFAPVKRARIDFIAEKATELGVSALVPVLTERTIVERVNVERLLANAVEAAEQTERLTVPEVRPPVRLVELLAAWPEGRHLILCDESGGAPPAVEVVGKIGIGHALAVLVGPEGGFSPGELDGLKKLAFVSAVALGPRVLRAETAALATLAVVQALIGDWRQQRRR